jgi:4-amino-4-deoxy-L-arabinose transferase-like glycosyltransferase
LYGNHLQIWAAKAYIGPLLTIAFVAIHGFDILTYPLVGFDEVLLNDAGRQLAETGQFRADVLGLNPGFESHYFWQPPALPLAAALVYRLLGFGLWQTRLPSIVFGGLAIWAVFVLVRNLRPHGLAASIAALSLFFWPAWVLTAKTARMDTGAVLALLLSTHLILRALDRKVPAYRQVFVAGVFASAALVFHTVAVPWVLALSITVFLFFPKRIALSALYGCGIATLIALWLIYAAQFPEEFEAQYLAHLSVRAAHEGMIERFTGHATRYWLELHKLPTFFVMLLLSAYAWSIRTPWKDKPLVALIVLTGATMALTAFAVGGRTAGYYTVYPLTLAFCVIGIAVEDAILQKLEEGPRWIAGTIGLATAAMILNGVALSVGPRLLAYRFQTDARNYALQTTPLTQRLKAGDQIWGCATLWFAAAKAGARLQTLDWVPPFNRTRPNPHRHLYVVVERGETFPGIESYVKLAEFGTPLPRVLGSTLSDRSYEFDLWKSREPTKSQ